MLIRHRDRTPEVHPTAWIAPTATLVGNVSVGPHARVLYGAVLDAEGSRVEVGASSIVAEHAVLRASAVAEPERPVLIADHVFVGPHACVLGAEIARSVYLAAHATVLHGAEVATGSCVAVGALVHANTVLPQEFFVPPHTTAVGSPVRVLGPDRPGELVDAIASAGFAAAAFGVTGRWEDRAARYERAAEIRSAEFAAHVRDTVVRG
ncbi:gamma carbonic anhydrase family protein [Amycolatopsis anabasis]|uniref:gamma carbonic anhydrase family protein n=1 Tax=Amycolatopsis anabasis TaxID=1840409 RepID=UPI00131CBEC4|nr:acyltransferase [Amycolatopsis anabasis]